MTEKTKLSEENVIFMKNKLHAQFSLGAEPQNGSGCKVIEAIVRCRTEACGTNVFGCTKYNRFVAVFRSCGNRHCPT